MKNTLMDQGLVIYDSKGRRYGEEEIAKILKELERDQSHEEPHGHFVQGEQTHLYIRGAERPSFAFINCIDPVKSITALYTAPQPAEPVRLTDETQDQIAAVMLRTGTPEQQGEALRYCGVGVADKEAEPWRVGLFWSSSTPGQQVKVLAHNPAEIERMVAHKSFIKWLEVPPVEGPFTMDDDSYESGFRDIHRPGHSGFMRVVWKMEDDVRSPRCEEAAQFVLDALNGAWKKQQAGELVFGKTVESAGPDKRWPFVETPGEFAYRFGKAYTLFNGDIVACVRHTLIENPPIIIAPIAAQPELFVWYGSMPESSGKSNWTALLIRKGESPLTSPAHTIDRSEYPDRVRYEADRVRFLIGELDKEPCILDYDADKCDSPVVAQPNVPDVREWQQALGRDDRMFTDGWNACREAMLKGQK